MFVFFSLMHFFFQMKHFINLLLVFELISLCVFLFCLCASNLSMNVIGLYFCVVILFLSVCESVMGLSVLVNSSRHSSMKQVKSFSFLSF